MFFKIKKKSELIYAKEYEEYLIIGKEEILNKIITGGIEYQYIKLIKNTLNKFFPKN